VRYRKWAEHNDQPTIFNRLQDAGRTWRVYYDETQVVPMTALIHAQRLFPYWLSNFATMQAFYKDVTNGTLPDYAFIEPRSFFNNNDYHPPAPSFDYHGIIIGGISDVRDSSDAGGSLPAAQATGGREVRNVGMFPRRTGISISITRD
jgi:phospholipase C